MKEPEIETEKPMPYSSTLGPRIDSVPLLPEELKDK